MYANILIPVLLDDEHDNQRSFAAAQALAAPDATLTVMHVTEAIPAFVAAEIPEDIARQNHYAAERALTKLADMLPGAQPLLVTGHAGRTILDQAEKAGTDCIVIASHKPGLEDYFLGSTAARVVRHAPCSVHVIR